MLTSIRNFFFGQPLDPMDKSSKRKLALTALIAWVGLGADGLSSSCYGPEESFLALQHHTSLALFLALLTIVTVFLIAFGYNQVIQLFPRGGGGYKVTTSLFGKYPGLVAGSALIMDYALTIVISVVSAVQALCSFLPVGFSSHQIAMETGLIVILTYMNLRGMKESIKILLPIFIGFLITHAALIIYGIGVHAGGVGAVVSQSVTQTHHLAGVTSVAFVAALFMHAYAMGGGTYTGLEAVSNNVNVLMPPRVKTGKITMLYMAISLSLTAGGIMMLYLLWHVVPNSTQTLNAVVFTQILHGLPFSHSILVFTLLCEAGLLFVAANTGFLGGPAVLANMSFDNWLPHRFRLLSNRLVKQNGILLFGALALLLLYVTEGHLVYLVVFYSFNVFLAFTLSLMSLVKHWWKERAKGKVWFRSFLVAFVSSFICGAILLMITLNRFFHGSLVAIVFLALLALLCVLIRRHYDRVNKKLTHADSLLANPLDEGEILSPEFDTSKPTAVFFVNQHIGVGMHTILWCTRLFPNFFKNMVFVTIGEIDIESYGAQGKLTKLNAKIKKNMDYYTHFAEQNGFATRKIVEHDVSPVVKMGQIVEQLSSEIDDCIYFASSFVWGKESWFAHYLHNETAFAIQRKLHMQNQQMIIIPMNIDAQ